MEEMYTMLGKKYSVGFVWYPPCFRQIKETIRICEPIVGTEFHQLKNTKQ